eukprot:2544326-Rhodomonas_salina.3
MSARDVAEAWSCRYDQRFGLYPTVLLCVCSFGLLAPELIVFRPPPRAEVELLSSDQRPHALFCDVRH